MKFVIQCVSEASCTVEGRVTGAIERGYLILVGISDSDTEETADRMLKKTAGLRVFPDENGKTNLSLADIEGSVLLISQFTLYADCRKGNRPSFVKAGKPEHAERLYRYLLDACRREGIGKTVEEGVFGADMQIALVNEGPFTLCSIPMNCNADKFKKIIDSGRQNRYTLFVLVIGLSPNGKATDSDSVILKVRILLAQRAKPSRSARFFLYLLF